MLYQKITSNEETLRKRVHPFDEKHFDDTIKHFHEEDVPRSTLYQIIMTKRRWNSQQKDSATVVDLHRS